MIRFIAITAAIVVVGCLLVSAAPADWRAWLGGEPDLQAPAESTRAQIRLQLAALRARRRQPTPTPGRGRLHDGEGRLWRLSLRREPNDGRLLGRVVVPSGGGLVEGRIDGTEQRGEVAGQVFDETGYPLATFSGARVDGRLKGTYEAADGESGEWSE